MNQYKITHLMKHLILRRATWLLPLLFCPFILFAGGGQPLWTKDTKSGVSWQKVTPLGLLITSTSRGLTGINTQTGEETWVIEPLKNAPESSYEAIPSSPFVSVSTQDGKNFCIVDPAAGKMIFNAREAGLEQVTEKHFLRRR
jgi:hypothetical protein